MDLELRQILDVQLVQSNEVKSSYWMEMEGLTRCLKRVEEEGVVISDLVTDRHPQIKAYMKKERSDINNWFDVWHMAEVVFKKLEAIGKKKKYKQVGDWSRSVSNHLYCCAASSEGDGDLVSEKWLSILNHITNVHEGHGNRFPKCLHGDLEDRDWIKKEVASDDDDDKPRTSDSEEVTSADADDKQKTSDSTENLMVFKHIFGTELKHEPFGENAGRTSVVYTIEKDTKIESNKNGIHAEKRMIDQLKESYVKTIGKQMSVDVYINNSPCESCACALISFLQTCRKANINIYFASLYNIKRKSCIKNKESHVSRVTKTTSDANLKGLRLLMDHKRCELHAFDKLSWKKLLGVLKIKSAEFDLSREYEDKLDDAYRTRKMEDNFLSRDLEYIHSQEILMEDVFEEMFSQNGGTMRIVYSVECQTSSFKGILKDDVNKLIEDLKKMQILEGESKKMNVNIYIDLDEKVCSIFSKDLRKFLKEHRGVNVKIYVVMFEALEFTGDSLKQLIKEKCSVQACELSSWESLLCVLDIQRPGLEEEYLEGKDNLRYVKDNEIRKLLRKIEKSETKAK